MELDLRRVNVPTVRISNNILIAAVSLDRTASSELIEKTNREGFIENEAYGEFRNAILYTLEMVEKLRKPDKDKIRNLYGPTPKSEPVMAQIDEVKKIIETKIKIFPTKEKSQETFHYFSTRLSIIRYKFDMLFDNNKNKSNGLQKNPLY